MQLICVRYMADPSAAYDATKDELEVLLAEFGEQDPIVDAIMIADGATDEARAAAIGCDVVDL